MEQVLSLLYLLICPLSMGLLMWVMGRRNSHESAPAQTPVPFRTRWRSFVPRLCLDKRVVAGTVTLGVAVWLLAPGAIGVALPLLILVVCPLSMFLMMRAMHGAHGTPPTGPAGESVASGVTASAPSLPVPPDLHG